MIESTVVGFMNRPASGRADARSIRKIRAVAILMLCCSGSTWADPPAPTEMRFRVLDGEQPVGTVLIQISGDSSSRTVITTSHLAIRKLLLKATVDRRIEEHWEGGRLESLSAEFRTAGTLGTSDKKLDVSRSKNGELLVKSHSGSRSLPGNALPMTLWGAPVLKGGVYFDATNGEQLTMTIAPANAGQSRTYQGRACRSFEVKTSGAEKTQFTVWQDADGTLCGLHQKSALADLSYQRVDAAGVP